MHRVPGGQRPRGGFPALTAVHILKDMSGEPSPVDQVRADLRGTGYLADVATATVVHLGVVLGKPVLVEGPAPARRRWPRAWPPRRASRSIRLQCYEGLDESKALYEWDYRRQLLELQLRQGEHGSLADTGIFGEEFLLARPLLAAIRAPSPVVLLIDEVDRLDMETEALLLEVLSEYQVSVPELGTVTARHIPQVFLTSNNTRDLSEALKRRCLFLHLGYPDVAREGEIIQLRVPGLADHLAAEIAAMVAVLRDVDLKKPPSVAESVDWARTLLALGADELSDEVIRQTMPVLLKYQRDIEIALAKLSLAR